MTIDDVIKQYPTLAAAIKWQHKPASASNAYAPPPASCKVALPQWTTRQKADLQKAFLDAGKWLAGRLSPAPTNPDRLTDEPVNVHPNVGDDSITALQCVSPAYMWKLYVSHVAFSLAVEATGKVGWSIRRYSAEQLRYLFDSTTMAWNLFGLYYWMGTYAGRVPALRRDNLPKTAFAPPTWTYRFMLRNGLIGPTRKETVCRVLDWMRQNMTHFYGSDTFGNCFAVWQYRGYPPLSKIVNGTTDSNNPNLGSAHYTAGCHGSVGFLNAVLRVVNVPVQPVWVCGHELACFLTEKLYLDHGDDPYNQNVRDSTQPISHLLIDEATYKTRFTSNLASNITDAQDPAGANVGRAAAEFPQ